MSALSKIGLVELSDEEKVAQAARVEASAPADAPPESADDIERLLRETRQMLGNVDEPAASPPAPTPAPPPPRRAAPPRPAPTARPTANDGPPPPPPPPVDGVAATEFAGDRPLASIYAESGIPESPFPAEKMLKVLAGLRAMPTETRKAAILAMDAADDDWTIDDAILDAQRKTRALETARLNLNTSLQTAEEQAATEQAAQDEYQEQATAEIRRQIAELEVLLQEEVSKVATEKATIHANLQATRDAAAREAARFDQTILDLGEIARTFGNG